MCWLQLHHNSAIRFTKYNYRSVHDTTHDKSKTQVPVTCTLEINLNEILLWAKDILFIYNTCGVRVGVKFYLLFSDDHAKTIQTCGLPKGAIPPIDDMDISEVNRHLYNT